MSRKLKPFDVRPTLGPDPLQDNDRVGLKDSIGADKGSVIINWRVRIAIMS